MIPTAEEVDRFLGKAPAPDGYNGNAGFVYDAELGWTVTDAIIPGEGVGGSHVYYHFERSGARRRVNFPEVRARIHTYGDSFTQCAQVNDGETWQEYLAGHMQEPIENFGVSGYSVYQAYRRMLKVEGQHPSEFIILNIYDDDHFRNLDSWRGIRGGRRAKYGNCFPLPHVRVDVAGDKFTEIENPCPTRSDLYKLTDAEWALERFQDDQIVRFVLAIANAGQGHAIEPQDIAIAFGLPFAPRRGAQPAAPRTPAHIALHWASTPSIQHAYTQAALFATQRILERIEKFVSVSGRKLMVVLSSREQNMKSHLDGIPPWDQSFLDYLKTRSYPVVDLRDLHLKEYQRFRQDPDAYLKRYYIGHYNPAGNFFCAMALKEAVVEWLNPRPSPYRRSTAVDIRAGNAAAMAPAIAG